MKGRILPTSNMTNITIESTAALVRGALTEDRFAIIGKPAARAVHTVVAGEFVDAWWAPRWQSRPPRVTPMFALSIPGSRELLELPYFGRRYDEPSERCPMASAFIIEPPMALSVEEHAVLRGLCGERLTELKGLIERRLAGSCFARVERTDGWSAKN